MIFWSLLNLAQALDCDFNPLHAPNGDFMDVPLNLRPFVQSVSPENFWSLRQEGEILSEDVEWFDLGGNAFQMIPTNLLEPNTDYKLHSIEFQDQIFAYLQTGESIDEEAPEAIVVDVERSSSQSEWGDTDVLSISLSDASDDIQIVRVELSEDEIFTAAQETWTSVLLSDSGDASFGIGQGLCDTTVSSDVLDSHRYLRLTFYDWAGNASDPLLVDSKYEQSLRKAVGCSHQNSPTWSVLALFWMVLRRRKLH